MMAWPNDCTLCKSSKGFFQGRFITFERHLYPYLNAYLIFSRVINEIEYNVLTECAYGI